jgi:hypothetical protein
MSATYVSYFRGYKDESIETARHLSQALRLLNYDLSTSPVPQETSITMVVSLALLANMSGDLQSSQIHLEGLQRIIDLYPGGLEGIRGSNKALMQKICRADNEFSILKGIRTQICPTSTVRRARFEATLYRHNEIPTLSPPLTQLCLPMQHIMRDILTLCCILRTRKLDGYQYQDVHITITQQLLEFSPISHAQRVETIDDACQLGLLTFMITIQYHRILRYIYSGILHQLLLEMLENDTILLVSKYLPFRLWLIFMYGLSVIEDKEKTWVIAELQKLIVTLQITSWTDGKKLLDLFPWIEVVHDIPGRKLWDLATYS